MQNILNYLQKRKYELLLLALIQHLFIGIFLIDLPFYTKVIWPINMVILGIASVGVFLEKGPWKNIIQIILFLLVVAMPIGLTFFGTNHYYFIFLNISYVVFFLFIFWEVLKYLIKPSYINTDIISASGYDADRNSVVFKGIKIQPDVPTKDHDDSIKMATEWIINRKE